MREAGLGDDLKRDSKREKERREKEGRRKKNKREESGGKKERKGKGMGGVYLLGRLPACNAVN